MSNFIIENILLSVAFYCVTIGMTGEKKRIVFPIPMLNYSDSFSCSIAALCLLVGVVCCGGMLFTGSDIYGSNLKDE